MLQDGEQYAKENGMVFLETSAKSTHNVNELFYEIGNLWYSYFLMDYLLRFPALAPYPVSNGEL